MNGHTIALFRRPSDTIEIRTNETFEEALARETLRSERLRLSIVAGLIGGIFVRQGAPDGPGSSSGRQHVRPARLAGRGCIQPPIDADDIHTSARSTGFTANSVGGYVIATQVIPAEIQQLAEDVSRTI